MTDRPPTPPPWWAVHPEPDCRPVILVSQREYKEIKRKKREEQEAAQLAARRNAKSQASMERRARRKGAVPPQLLAPRAGAAANHLNGSSASGPKSHGSDLHERLWSVVPPTDMSPRASGETDSSRPRERRQRRYSADSSEAPRAGPSGRDRPRFSPCVSGRSSTCSLARRRFPEREAALA